MSEEHSINTSLELWKTVFNKKYSETTKEDIHAFLG